MYADAAARADDEHVVAWAYASFLSARMVRRCDGIRRDGGIDFRYAVRYRDHVARRQLYVFGIAAVACRPDVAARVKA